MHRLWILVVTTLFLASTESIRVRIPVGIIVEPGDELQVDLVRHALWLLDGKSSWPRQYVLELKQEFASSDDAVQLDRAVCRLLEEGVLALIAPTSSTSYKVLASYSEEFALPLISPIFPILPRSQALGLGVSIQPSTTMALLALLREYQWKDIVYIYDRKYGAERVSHIFQQGFRVLGTSLLGLVEATSAQQVNQYLRKLEATKRRRSLRVVLDTDSSLALQIINWHVHDFHVGKEGYHFIVANPVLDHWRSRESGFGAVNVTLFPLGAAGANESFLKILKELSLEKPEIAKLNNLTVMSYLFHDSALVLGESLQKFLRGKQYVPSPDDLYVAKTWSRKCLETPTVKLPDGYTLADYIKQSSVTGGLTGTLEFNDSPERKNIEIPVMEVSKSKFKLVGKWSDMNQQNVSRARELQFALSLPQTNYKEIYRIASILNPPYLMLREDMNGTGNERFEGYCKDLMDLLAEELDFVYNISLSPDGEYGRYNKTTGMWTGMIGQILRGEADLAVADLHISAERHRVVDFADYHLTASLSLLMKNPERTSAGITPLSAFTVFSYKIWICIAASAALVIILFHLLFKFSGDPDNIGAASGLWGKKFSIIGTVWFVLGSGLFQSTAVYPRGASGRVLGTTWWCFNLALLALYVASSTTQFYLSSGRFSDEYGPKVTALSTLSLETIVKESMITGWPNIAIVKNGRLHRFIKQSSIPFLKDYEKYIEDHPEIAVRRVSDGVQRVRQSEGDHAIFLESLYGHFFSRQQPCDTVAIHDIEEMFFYAVALPIGSQLRHGVNDVFSKFRVQGKLNFLREKWFLNKSVCESTMFRNRDYWKSLHAKSGLFYFLALGIAFVALATVAQYFWRVHKKDRRQKLSFEEVAMGQSLPLPPPELLRDSSEEEENGAMDGWAERKLVPTSFGLQQHDDAPPPSKALVY